MSSEAVKTYTEEEVKALIDSVVKKALKARGSFQLQTELNARFINMMIDFIEHNKKLGHISGMDSVDDFLYFIGNVKNNYLPMVEQINGFVKELRKDDN